MRMSTPRVAPLEATDWDQNQKELMQKFQGEREPINIFKTLVRHEKLLKRWTVFANHILGKSTIPERERELIILRIGWRCKSGYEWSQHVEIGLKSGLTEEEIQRIKVGPEDADWSETDRLLLRATDELFDDAFISDGTWGGLQEHFNEQQLMDIVFTVGNYNMVSMALNTFGVQLESFTKNTYP